MADNQSIEQVQSSQDMVKLVTVDELSQIRENINTFINDAGSSPDYARKLLRSGEKWFYDPDDECFGFSKFLGFKSMNFANYAKCRKKLYEGERFDAGVTSDAIINTLKGKVSNNSFSENEELKNKLINWAEELIDKNVFDGIKQDKWRFMVLPQKRSYWAFLANPSIYDVEKAIESLPSDTWTVKNHKVKKGDGVVFWRGLKDKKRGVVGLGEVVTNPKELGIPPQTKQFFLQLPSESKERRVWVRFHKTSNAPLWLDEDRTGTLDSLTVSKGQGTVFHVTVEQWNALKELLGCETNNNFPINTYSWTILSPTVFIKEIDKSVFRDGTGIPIDIRKFFDIEDMNSGEQRAITLTHKDTSYSASIVMDKQPTPRTQIRWNSDLAHLLQDEFPDWYEAITNEADITSELPEIRFTKTDEYAYSMEFIHPSEIESDIESDYADDYEPQKEGKLKYYYGKRYERNPENRKKAIEIHGTLCLVCDFDFEKFYGSRGKGYIEVHHTKPLAENGEEIVVNPETDLAPVCSNCHKMIHRRRNNILSIEQMKKIVNC